MCRCASCGVDEVEDALFVYFPAKELLTGEDLRPTVEDTEAATATPCELAHHWRLEALMAQRFEARGLVLAVTPLRASR